MMLNSVLRRYGEPRFVGTVTARAFFSPDSIRHRIDTGKGHKGFLVLKAANVSNLGHQLRAEGFPNAVHLHDNGIFRQHEKPDWFISAAVCFNGVRRLPVSWFAASCTSSFVTSEVSGNQCYGRLGKCVHLFGIALCLKMVAVPLAPFAVALCEGVQAVVFGHSPTCQKV